MVESPAAGETALEPEEERSFELERLVFFSDAVFAIAITLLVLEIKVPDRPEEVIAGESFSYISSMWGAVGRYALSFLVVGVYWVGHHRIFRFIKRYDHALLWINLLFLLTVAFVPVPTNMIGQYGDLPVGPAVYAGSLALTGLLLSLLWWYASYKHRLVAKTLSDAFIRIALLRTALAALIFLLSIPIAFANPQLAEYTWILIFVVMIFSNSRIDALALQG